MAYELHDGASYTFDNDGTRNYTRVFRVNTGNAALRPGWGIAGVAISRYDSYPDDVTALAVGVSSVALSGQLGWFDVTYNYTTKPFDKGSGDATGNGGDPGQNDQASQPNPTLRTPKIRFGTNTRNVPFERDWDSPRKRVANSAAEPFTGLEVEDCTQTMTVSFNIAATCNVSVKQSTYVNKVNDAGFAVVAQYGAYDEGTLRCNGWGGELQYESGYGWFIGAEVEFEYKPDGWHREILDQGFYERKATSPGIYERVKVVNNATGQPSDAPVLLNGAGVRLADSGTEVYLTFYPYEWVAFTNIFA